MSKPATAPPNHLFYGDNLDVLRRHVSDESVDLVYLDPPFNSQAGYNVLYAEQDGTRAAAQIRAFEDTWIWSIEAEAVYLEVVETPGEVSSVMQAFRTFLGTSNLMAYLVMMAPRLMELRRVLKPTGSIYLHCDPTASHYLKLLMDAIFSPANFLSEIIWKRSSAHSSAKRYGPIHDTLLYYSKGPDYIWNEQFQPYDPEYLATFFEQRDADGRQWKRMDLTANGVRHGDSGKPWRGIDVTAKGRHWAVPGDTCERLKIKGGTVQERLDALDAAGVIHWPKKEDGMPRLKQYADQMPGVPLQDIWTDIRPLHNLAAERLGYPTQKPEALLDRIIQASSNEGDVVLDPFCGCGTAIASAQRLNRRWIGIDITHIAVSLIKNRLYHAYGREIKKSYSVIGEPTDLASARVLASEPDRHQFQSWAVGLVDARSTGVAKKGADRGIDGRLIFHDEADTGKTKQVILSVKSGHVNDQQIRDLLGVLDQQKAAIGVFITMNPPTKPMKLSAAEAGFYESPYTRKKHPRLQILTIEELLAGKEIDMPPNRQTNVTFKRAPRAKGKAEERRELFGGD